jgi:hypothetical protein
VKRVFFGHSVQNVEHAQGIGAAGHAEDDSLSSCKETVTLDTVSYLIYYAYGNVHLHILDEETIMP